MSFIAEISKIMAETPLERLLFMKNGEECLAAFIPYVRIITCNFIKKRVQHRCFPVKFAKFLRTPFWHNTSGRLLLKFQTISVHFSHSTSAHLCASALRMKLYILKGHLFRKAHGTIWLKQTFVSYFFFFKEQKIILPVDLSIIIITLIYCKLFEGDYI